MVLFFDQPCSRCGSKKLISKTWEETVDTYNGKSKLEISQIICSNKECQSKFEERLAQDMKKHAELKLHKENEEKMRKEKIQQNILRSRESRKKNELIK